MAEQILNGSSYVYEFLMVSSSDGQTAVTGASPVPAVQISKNGGTFANTTNAATEISNGWYKVTLTSTETNTNGGLIVRATEASSLEWREKLQVVEAVPDVNIVSSDATVDANIVSEDVGYTPSDATLSSSTLDDIADTILSRKVSEVRSAGALPAEVRFTLVGSILATAGKNVVSGSALNTYEETNTTIEFSRTIVTNASAVPIISVA